MGARSRPLWISAFALAAVTGMTLLAALNPANVLNWLAPRAGIEFSPSIAYGAGPRRTLDVYAPAGVRDAPVIVFFYGGSWQRGDKAAYAFVARTLARRGYVTVVPDYRVYPEVRFPDFLDDGAMAVRWARDNASRFGADPTKLFLMGHSAGGHIAAMLAFDGRWLAKVGMRTRREVAGFIGLAGPYDFLPLVDPMLKIVFREGEIDMTQTQPITFVAGGEPPVFLATGRLDTTVMPRNSEQLSARLREKGGEVTHIVYPWVGHLPLIGAFSPLLRWLAPVERDVCTFVDRVAAEHDTVMSRSGPGSGVGQRQF